MRKLLGVLSRFYQPPNEDYSIKTVAKRLQKYVESKRENVNNRWSSNRMKITRPGVKLSDIKLTYEEYGIPEEEEWKARRAANSTSYRVDDQKDDDKDDDKPGPKSAWTYYLTSDTHGKFSNNGVVMYFISKNSAKKMRNIANRRLNKEVYRIAKLTKEESDFLNDGMCGC